MISQQILHEIKYKQLKNLSNFTLNLEPHPITGIFGPNGSGKSTIIYSILCVYQPTKENPHRIDYNPRKLFTPTTHTNYNGSSFDIIHSYRQGKIERKHVKREYTKNKRWKPRYTDRPERDVYFIGLDTCVPEIEKEKSETLITFTTKELNDKSSQNIKQKAEFILNRSYQKYNSHDFKKKVFKGVCYDNISYSSLAMGAGEQRVFKILEVLFKADKYSLIVIDEVGLTLHTDALNRLLEVLLEQAKKQNIQIVFTSHREEVAKMDKINIRHIHQTQGGTICFDNSKPDCMARLTGKQERILEIFVEDSLSEAIVRKVVENLNVRRHCSIKIYGAIQNSFPLATGLYLKGDNLDNTLILLDGDKYQTEDEKTKQMKKHFTGSEQDADEKRTNALKCIRQYCIPDGFSPEQFVHNKLKEISDDDDEIVKAARQINAVRDKHDFVDQIITQLGYEDYQVGLNKVADKLFESPCWSDYVKEISDWLGQRAQALGLV
ncbi:AAA family ATPase [Microscilla marina]|uniref:AAA+ ATPase domain-containing protein n=1 Tax=Microscilla marina ATCC 23134 TaxID=313606 RepID=A1ZTB8_MICM2|nr:AAA family ATPase [Microscilla marina]EAY26340.1 conserved hypothetical protein [Microscilla marina ATCC 23134]